LRKITRAKAKKYLPISWIKGADCGWGKRMGKNVGFSGISIDGRISLPPQAGYPASTAGPADPSIAGA
jgi:hypothetical protein